MLLGVSWSDSDPLSSKARAFATHVWVIPCFGFTCQRLKTCDFEDRGSPSFLITFGVIVWLQKRHIDASSSLSDFTCKGWDACVDTLWLSSDASALLAGLEEVRSARREAIMTGCLVVGYGFSSQRWLWRHAAFRTLLRSHISHEIHSWPGVSVHGHGQNPEGGENGMHRVGEGRRERWRWLGCQLNSAGPWTRFADPYESSPIVNWCSFLCNLAP